MSVQNASHANSAGSMPIDRASRPAPWRGCVVTSSSSMMRGLVSATYAVTRSRTVGVGEWVAGRAVSPVDPGRRSPSTGTSARAAYQPTKARGHQQRPRSRRQAPGGATPPRERACVQIWRRTNDDLDRRTAWRRCRPGPASTQRRATVRCGDRAARHTTTVVTRQDHAHDGSHDAVGEVGHLEPGDRGVRVEGGHEWRRRTTASRGR